MTLVFLDSIVHVPDVTKLHSLMDVDDCNPLSGLAVSHSPASVMMTKCAAHNARYMHSTSRSCLHSRWHFPSTYRCDIVRQ